MAKCTNVNLIKLQGHFLGFIVESHSELDILEHLELCSDCRKHVLHAVQLDMSLLEYGNLFQREFDDQTIPQYSDYPNVTTFIDARIEWRKRKLRELIKNAEMELEDLETRL